MSILLGILLYGFCVLFFCALTRANGVDDPEPFAKPKRAEERFEPVSARGAVHAPEAPAEPPRSRRGLATPIQPSALQRFGM